MYIKGVTDYDRNGEARNTGLFSGPISQDGELRTTQGGKTYATASVRAFNRKDGTAVFMTLKTFSESLTGLVSNLRKGDRVLACGVVENREYNGKQYTDMLLDFLLTSDAAPVSAAQSANRSALESRMEASGFDPIDGEDGELPF